MEMSLTKTFCLDGDHCQVIFLYDGLTGKYFGEYPDFEEEPRYTPGGHPWVTAMQEECRYSENRYAQGRRCMDCGSCQWFQQETDGDLIGICIHPQQRKDIGA